MNNLLQVSGILFWITIFILIALLTIKGKKWFVKIGLHIFSLTKTVTVIEKILKESPNKIKKETVAELIGTILWRITRIGFITLLITSIPMILLFQQNLLIKNQNELFGEQNGMISIQSGLLENQNKLIINQIRPYINTSSSSTDKRVTDFFVLNSPAFVDSLIIEFYVKEFGNNPFVLIDRQIEKNITLYPNERTSNKTRIVTNILTKEFSDDLKKHNKRLKRETKIYYSNLRDEIGNNDLRNRYYFERTDFFSKKTEQWYLKEESEK